MTGEPRVTVGLPPGRLRAAVVLLAASMLMTASACIPSERGRATEVGDPNVIGEGPAAPVFPETGVVPDDLLAAGLLHDLSVRPLDTSFWVPSTPEAECLAEGVVDAVGGPRLSELGYRPATAGAGLNELDLDDAERSAVVDVVEQCVDMETAVASMFFGDGRMRASVASCLAEGLGERGVLRPFAQAIVLGEPVDPYAAEGVLATAMLDQSVVCVPDRAFDWQDLDLPGEAPVLDADSIGGVPGSPFVDDQATTTTTTP